VSLGTHLPWAKEKAIEFMHDVAKEMPECMFHFSLGRANVNDDAYASLHDDFNPDNLQIFEYLPYDLYLENYDAAIIHGGTGITYSCIKAAVPMLVWPHDYDQFDHQARIVGAGLGLGFRQSVEDVCQDLQTLFESEAIQTKLDIFQEIALEHNPCERVLACIRAEFSQETSF